MRLWPSFDTHCILTSRDYWKFFFSFFLSVGEVHCCKNRIGLPVITASAVKWVATRKCSNTHMKPANTGGVWDEMTSFQCLSCMIGDGKQTKRGTNTNKCIIPTAERHTREDYIPPFVRECANDDAILWITRQTTRVLRWTHTIVVSFYSRGLLNV